MAEAADNVVLVTGASGYVGCHVTQQLLQAGYRVRGSVRDTKNEKKVKPLHNLCPDAKHPLELVEADLMKPESWLEAVKGCSYVMHVASPFPTEAPKNDDDVIKPAVEGTLSVLKACAEAGGVKRIILTSSMAAIYGGVAEKDKIYDENDWIDTSHPGAYYRSKMLAEKAAWDYVKDLPEDKKFELVVMNPGLIMGPILTGTVGASIDIACQMLSKKMPMLPDVDFDIVDVRDVAAAHLKGMVLPEASGHRHPLSTKVMTFQDIAIVMSEEFKPQGYSVPTTVAPHFVMKIVAVFNSGVKLLIPALGQRHQTNNKRMLEVLKIEPRDTKDTIVDMCYDVIEMGLVPKKPTYKGPKKPESAQ